jgi:hypothetical protein
MKIIKKILKYLAVSLGGIILIVVGLLVYFNIPVSRSNEAAQLGVTFSNRYASDIGLDWKKTYLAVLDDLKVKKIRIPIYWDLTEIFPGQYDFSDVDWQLNRARMVNAEITLVVGQKVPRWPECAIPEWYKNDDAKRKENLLKFIDIVIARYKSNPEIKYWQVENEPFLVFGVCPKADPALLDAEIALVKKEDPSRNVIITDSGELSLWFGAAKRADIFGTTMYRSVYSGKVGYFTYPIGPRFFHFKYWLINSLLGQNRAIVSELQAEPWISGWTVNAPLEEQFKSFNTDKLKENVIFARQVGFPEVYLWGAEWWYWLKTEKNHPELWETAKTLLNTNKN